MYGFILLCTLIQNESWFYLNIASTFWLKCETPLSPLIRRYLAHIKKHACKEAAPFPGSVCRSRHPFQILVIPDTYPFQILDTAVSIQQATESYFAAKLPSNGKLEDVF